MEIGKSLDCLNIGMLVILLFIIKKKKDAHWKNSLNWKKFFYPNPYYNDLVLVLFHAAVRRKKWDIKEIFLLEQLSWDAMPETIKHSNGICNFIKIIIIIIMKKGTMESKYTDTQIHKEIYYFLVCRELYPEEQRKCPKETRGTWSTID